MTERLEPPPWTFGDRLRKVRRSRHLSQREFARLLSESEKSIANWEGDVSRPRDVVSLSRKVQDTYGVPAEWLLGIGLHTRGYQGGSRLVGRLPALIAA